MVSGQKVEYLGGGAPIRGVNLEAPRGSDKPVTELDLCQNVRGGEVGVIRGDSRGKKPHLPGNVGES